MKFHSSYDSDSSIMAPGKPFDGTRPGYSYCHGRIDTTAQFKATLRHGAYTSEGYPLFFVTDDVKALCFHCAQSEHRTIIDSIRHRSRDSWLVVACIVNWECPDLCCYHCSKLIGSAYGE